MSIWPKILLNALILPDMCGQESGIAKDVKYILRGWYEQGLTLSNFHTVDVSFTPETDDNNE